MMFLKNCILLLALECVSLLPLQHALHSFQQNRYEITRYNGWIASQFKRVSKSLFGPLCFTIVLSAGVLTLPQHAEVVALVLGILYFLFLLSQEKKKHYIKPLVYTARVIRQCVVMVLLQTLFFIGMMVLNMPMAMVFATFLPWLMIYAMALVTYPMEEAIKKGYQKKAEKILNNMPQLIKIGITGSYGKTSSKNIVQAILSEKYYSLMTPASFNTPMGITITIRQHLKALHQVFVCEMGADHVNDIKVLCDFVKPKYGIVTSIGPQHLNTFGSLENIIYEKMTLIESLPQDGVGIINVDNEYIRDYQIKNTCKIVRYGIHNPDVDLTADEIEYSPQGSTFTVHYKDEAIRFTTSLLGEHNISNILASIAVGLQLGVSWQELVEAVKKVRYVEHRLELKKINGYTFIDDAFNSNPSGSKMALQVLKMMPNKRVIVTPGMIDLGTKQDEYNQAFGEAMLGCADEVILVGVHQTKAILAGLKKVGFDENHIHVVDTVHQAFAWVYANCTPEDTILLENDLPDMFNQ